MAAFRIRLLGKFAVWYAGQELLSLDAYKAQELLSYLLVHRDQVHSRESLAGLLWGESSTAQSKKNLRQVLWRLQSALDGCAPNETARVLLVDQEWVRVNPEADLTLDVAVLEHAFSRVQGVPGQELDEHDAASLRTAADLYVADLLEGWYQDWCLQERERIQHMYLSILDKLMSYCEAHELYEDGLTYGERILLRDRARERTHRQVMRLQYLGGDRTGALRQFDRCVHALREELDVVPSERTIALSNQIRADRLDGQEIAPVVPAAPSPPAMVTLREVLDRLHQVDSALASAQATLRQDIALVEKVVYGHLPDERAPDRSQERAGQTTRDRTRATRALPRNP